MRPQFRALLIMGFIFSLSACFYKPKGKAAPEPLLKAFLYQSPQCQMAPMPDDIKLPCGINRNPFLTTDSKALDCLVEKGDPISGMVFSTRPKSTLNEALLLVYPKPYESGVSAFRFASDADFTAFKNQLPKHFLNHPRSPLILGKNLAFFLWSDPGGESCLQELKQTIPETLNKLGLKE